ncbi:HAMP domain-containing protein [Hassallia byssoidea VB512170]|uniref:Circadian input-output histidine kinase CikA n=1 Tax=Hassallia byssoidea VB512170 TaxID=1304833 RepID=A0A846H473_9CYAN|nr:HAMP domain-containing protein [Hassalia byssoidea]NEU72417.1 HAMP domain-containing protein [Hassalia byssoidea VB512170]
MTTQIANDTDNLDLKQLLRILAEVKKGNFSARMPLDHTGIGGKIADTLNDIIDMNERMAAELERVSNVVGKEGKINERATLGNAKGSWKAAVESVNTLVTDLVQPTAETARVIRAVANGDLSQAIATETQGRPLQGEFLQTAQIVNKMVDQLNSFASEVTRVAREVGTEGKLGVQAQVPEVAGTWKDLTDSVNLMAGNLTDQVRNIAEVTTAVANGDLSKKITVNVKGEILDLKNTINTMVDQLNSFASEVTRVAREVGNEGKLGVQADVRGVAGTWKDLTDSVNSMAGNLTAQVRNIAEVTTAVANGDLSKKITVNVKGEILDLKNTVNTMVDQLNSFASEVTRVAREVGAEGKLGGQAEVRGVAGTWKDLTESVNFMAGSLTAQVRNIAEVTTAVANGDLSKKITVDVKGEILELKNTINTMVDQLNSFASEVTRVAREVGTEGKLGAQAEVRGVAGTWKDLTDNVNLMAGNLTGQVRNIAEVATAIAKGDLSKKITVDVKGEILELKNTINIMVDQLNSFASEVTRVAREVGSEGKLGGQADVRGVAGTWKDLTDSVNFMAGSLTSQVRNIAEVTTAVANGDLSKKITVDVKGEILELKNTVNTMVDQLNSFSSEVTRVAREVGSEGKLGVQAEVRGVAGTWKDLTDSVNFMAGSLTAQVRNIAEVTTAVANGDLSKKITVDVKGEILELKNTINTMVDQLNSFASEVTRVVREVGTEGKLGVQAYVRGVAGIWKDLTDNVNLMADNLTGQVRNIAEVAGAIANGNLSKKITVDVKGEILELKNTINTMVDQLSSFASEVTRVAREVGTEGKLGGQAQVTGVAGIWKDLTDNVNSMAGNLTAQVRGIAKVVTAVANGDLKRKLMLDAQGEIETLADTINEMIDTLATFADQVTTVAREVGSEGKLGGQAKVPGASGLWRDLTDNVNELAANLTTQVRAIAEVAIGVTKGDLTRSISVEAQGEVAILKDNINQMIANLRETTQKNTEQDWLKTNLARFTRILQGQRDLETVTKLILSELAPLVAAQHGVFFMMESSENHPSFLKLLSSYAYRERKNLSNRFHLGEGLVGQCALEKERILLTHVPQEYITIASGLGEASPMNVVVLPVLFEGQVTAVIELASMHRFSEIHLTFLDQLTESIAIVLNTIAASMRTEELLKQSQSLTEELQSQQKELTDTNKRLEQQAQSLKASEDLLKRQQEQLQQTNEELEEKAELLAMQNREVERKNREIEQARQAIEEKAEQLSMTSKYKSQFLANMSHELRTPLNSLLILARLLADNTERNLTQKQVEYSYTIYSAGNDLLGLINDILDLAKIESGTMSVEIEETLFTDLQNHVEGTFRSIAQDKNLDFRLNFDDRLPRAIYTDTKRLQQVLKNLLSNAFKFTEQGHVSLSVSVASHGWSADAEMLNRAGRAIAFAVSDTGIGIASDKQQVIFEAFQQADGKTNRKYGGTGLGLSISREIARLLGGEIRLVSELGNGSTFILYLPQTYYPSVEVTRIQGEQGRGQGGLLGGRGQGEFVSLSPLSPRQSLQRREPPQRAGNPSPSSPSSPLSASSPSLPPSPPLPTFSEQAIADDRQNIESGDRTLLIIEDDLNFARIMLDMAREQGFKGVIASRGDVGLAMAQELQPAAIMLDIHLPGMDGWTILDRLKHDPGTRHIPVHIMTSDEGQSRSLQQGAIAFLQKPVSSEALFKALSDIKQFVERPVKNLLIIEDDDIQRNSIAELIGNSDVASTGVSTGAAALAALKSGHFDCVVLDLGLPDMSGIELIEQIKEEPSLNHLPIVIYTGKDLTPHEETELQRISNTIIVKDVRSPERLLDETALFLHRVQANLPLNQQMMLEQVRHQDPVLTGKKVLIVDDDVRNIFALTSLLERYQMEILYAENGRDGITMLENHPDINIVLMDVMMPGMDGYETMQAIRQLNEFKNLPMIALTAKAMKGDREKCIDAGASDYITKPVDTEQLLSLLRVWLYR